MGFAATPGGMLYAFGGTDSAGGDRDDADGMDQGTMIVEGNDCSIMLERRTSLGESKTMMRHHRVKGFVSGDSHGVISQN